MSTSPTPDRRRLLRHLLIVLIMVVFAYLVAVTVSMLVGDQQKQAEFDRVGGTRTTWTPQTADGAALSTEGINRAEKVFGTRLKAAGVRNAEVAADDNSVTVSVPGDDPDLPADLGARRELLVRPVIDSVPAESAGSDRTTATPDQTKSPLAERIQAQRALRQSDNPLIQVQALLTQAKRCGQDDDPLAGRDDPALPLVTCAADATMAYLLGPAILDGEQIDRASTEPDGSRGALVNLVLTRDGKREWSHYTGTHVGEGVAFTLDTAVISAPVINEAMPAEAVQLSGYTDEQAGDLADAINGRALPVAFEATRTEQVEATAASSNFSSPEFGLIAGGFVLMIALIGGLVFVMARERS
ncbi:hypothetical protein H7J07_04425 [Mycobacterium koreense]|uniref:SecDF P1 head subdomain domain-containing protein n=1 Tax=Mycolicibacillus koreensis TaxID=1069220 RepID=A0A7I7SAG2_9MYCO|nr:hypothetical protein [Mycolicibacillus koreensis]MCV7247501.1 hypothetical protein [Mycolicibacillus koreensis]ODR06893.1 hypothetical protein BHQ15_12055 [Mycolicibacillus koreensis]OSC34560.1 hypothetical protein B8W67_06215 [Mycolicibacillus koreensis]BBY53877.1 hypothetical protein MKOR_11280 [Mycolicibacillus koreensis]